MVCVTTVYSCSISPCNSADSVAGTKLGAAKRKIKKIKQNFNNTILILHGLMLENYAFLAACFFNSVT